MLNKLYFLLKLLHMYILFIATRPLVRQIENLQATYNAQTASWEKIEKNLTDRLSIYLVFIFFIIIINY